MAGLKSLRPSLQRLASALKSPPKQTDDFYRSPPWLKCIAAIKRERGDRCEDCGAENCTIHGDHIVERKDGGAPFDKRNIRLRCIPCHNTKTAQARQRRNAPRG